MSESPTSPESNSTSASDSDNALVASLRKHFGFRAFLQGQDQAIQAVLGGTDALVIMPTGSGKSLCYQLGAMLMDGVTLVVSPLIALMKDQVDGLLARGLPATFINSSVPAAEMRQRLDGLRRGQYRLVYVAPERFRNESFRNVLAELAVTLVAVDEAHCISQWGHDFRPDYLRLRNALNELPDARVMALTATATPDVRADIVKQLGLGEAGRPEPEVLVYGFERPNLQLVVSRAASHQDKLRRVRAAIEEHRTGIVYCATRRQVETVAGYLRQAGTACVLYHGGLSDEERENVQNQFMGGEVPVVVATNAFGMGVDRADLRFVLHWDTPGSIEAYYQEIGRAGRDGEEARCELLFNYADVRTQEFFIEGGNPKREDVLAVWDTLQAGCRVGPVTRSVADWVADMPGLTNEMAARTSIYILERAGLVRRFMEPGSRTYTTSLVEGADPAVLDEQFERLAEKRRHDESKLQNMLRYVDAPLCRHAFILRYFGEAREEERCRACDNCGALAAGDRRAPTEEEWTLLQKALSCVARMKGRFGRGRVAQVLVGSRAKPVLDMQLDQSPAYGLLADHSEVYVRQLLDELIRDRSIEVASGEYPTIAITARGREVMWRKTEVELLWPERAPPASPKRKKQSGNASVPVVAARDHALVEALRSWRMKTAKARGVPAYVVCNDRSLHAIAAARPDSHAALEAVHGMGPNKVAQFGNAILEVLDAHPPTATS